MSVTAGAVLVGSAPLAWASPFSHSSNTHASSTRSSSAPAASSSPPAPQHTVARRTASTPRHVVRRHARRPAVPGNLVLPLRRLRWCEASGNYGANTGNGYFGAYQFNYRTWVGMGYRGLPSSAPALVQDLAAVRLHASRGWQPWPSCSATLGLR
jgi:hypothetical protein